MQERSGLKRLEEGIRSTEKLRLCQKEKRLLCAGRIIEAGRDVLPVTETPVLFSGKEFVKHSGSGAS